jgi:myo-inositol 2-dehydrogenase/D-chiro-inositol 1-dehydrogenase
MIRLALVGCGEHSRFSHAAPLARYTTKNAGDLELVATCDLNIDRAQEFCRDFGFARAYSDVKTMLATERLDGCVCVMPVERIVELAVMLLERKIPCVIEKPLGTSLQEAERLARVTRETGTPHMVSVNRRFMPFLKEAKSWVQSIGPLEYIRATQVRHARVEPDFIWTTAIHVLDALRYVAGEVAKFETEVHRHAGISSTWYGVTLRFESGAQARIEVLPTAGMVEESYELFGEGFRARVSAGSGPQRSIQCWRDGRLEIEKHSSEDEPEDLRNGAYDEVVEFVRALKTGKPPWPSVEEILPSARICFAIAESIAQMDS